MRRTRYFSTYGLKSSAGVGVVVEHVVAASAFNSDRVSHCTVGTDKVVKIAAANVKSQVTYYVPKGKTYEVWRAVITNLDSKPRKLSSLFSRSKCP